MKNLWRAFICLIGGVFWTCLITGSASAHEIKPGYLQITQTGETLYRLALKTPMQGGRPLPILPVLPEDCALKANPAGPAGLGGASDIRNWTAHCEISLRGRSIALSGLSTSLSDMLVRVSDLDGKTQTMRAGPNTPFIEIAAKPTSLSVTRTYFALGLEHILGGIDHLLFVLALVLLISGVRRLIETITAFTIAHSLTLVATTLGWVSLPSAPVEAVIALSIVFLATEIVKKQDGKLRLSERWPWMVAFVFGLLHGFGFAGALADIGLPSGEVPLALLCFNLGVEAGQLVFLAGVIVILKIVSALRAREMVEKFASYGIGIMASVWMFERLM